MNDLTEKSQEVDNHTISMSLSRQPVYEALETYHSKLMRAKEELYGIVCKTPISFLPVWCRVRQSIPNGAGPHASEGRI
jgi:hypothetical protein